MSICFAHMLSVGSIVLHSDPPSSRNCVPFLFRVCAIVHCSVSSSGDEALKCSSSRSEVKLSNKTCLLQSIENFSYS